jgi:phenylalanyl-tRNA synthetase alpha chain
VPGLAPGTWVVPRALDSSLNDRGFLILGGVATAEVHRDGDKNVSVDFESLSGDLHRLKERALADVAAAADPGQLEQLQIQYLGKKGELTAVLRGIGALPAEDRPRVGAVANEVGEAVKAALADRGTELRSVVQAQRLAAESVDVTLPGRTVARGMLHPILETIDAIAEVFGQFGFVVYEGPEVEDDLTNFQMLNIAPDHPARDLWDTLYVDIPGHLLRTHTSPGQIRVMQTTRPPIRALLPGRCFRYEAVDASHGFEFFQVEGLMVDEGTSMADLKGLLDEFAHALFGPRRTRFRPGYYPFTEPSVAFDVECVVCGGVGCPACSKSGWMTILGAGMVHPVVLQYGGIDPERYQGFAFGMGVERISNLRHAVPDLRYYLENDLRFLEQFR